MLENILYSHDSVRSGGEPIGPEEQIDAILDFFKSNDGKRIRVTKNEPVISGGMVVGGNPVTFEHSYDSLTKRFFIKYPNGLSITPSPEEYVKWLEEDNASRAILYYFAAVKDKKSS